MKILRTVLGEVEGYLTLAEANKLYELAKQVDTDSWIVEIGALYGRSTICLALGVKGKMVTIDPFGEKIDCNYGYDKIDFTTFKNNLLKFGVQHKIIPIVGLSEDVLKFWRVPIGLLFMDGNHDYEHVKDDLRFTEYIPKGGFLVIHDYRHFQYSGLTQAVDEFKNDWGNTCFKWEEIPGENSVMLVGLRIKETTKCPGVE